MRKLSIFNQALWENGRTIGAEENQFWKHAWGKWTSYLVRRSHVCHFWSSTRVGWVSISGYIKYVFGDGKSVFLA